MSTQIDRLEVEISSNSGGAAAGIDALAASLGKLKQNGTISVAVKNLNNLTSALKGMTSVASNANKISSLADSMAKLKSVGSTGAGVKKLAESLQALKSIDFSAVSKVADSGATLERVASSLSHLSAVKAGGVPALVNALSKLDQVTNSLDDGSIARFAERVEKLNTVLGPLATKCTSIKEAFKGINLNARTAAGGIKNLNTEVKVGVLNMSNYVIVMQGVINTLRPIIQLLSSTISQAIEWDGIAARFSRGFGDSAEDVYAWIQRLNKEMGINVQQFMQYSSVYATMLQGFGVGAKDSAQMALGYTELTYDIWAGYNDVYKNFADAAEAVKSAIAGEVEPIRRAGFTIVEATLEQTAANHGLKISLEKATEAQKSYLRYLTLVDQAKTQNLVGTYAKELNTAEGMMRTFSQQLKSLAQTFGSVFLPILVKVMPWLQAFVDLLGDAIIAVANFFGVEIQKANFGDSFNSTTESVEGTTGAVQDTTEALKELKNAAVGIDELNVISPQSGSNGSGSGSGDSGWGDLDVGSLWDESIFDSIQSQVDDIKAKIKDMLPVIGIVASAFAGWRLVQLLTDIDDVVKKLDTMTPKIKNLGKNLAISAITVAVGTLIWDFTGTYLEGGDETELLKAIGTTTLGAALAAFLAGKKGAALVIVTSGVITLTRLAFELKDGTVEWSDPEALATAFTGLIETAIGGALTWKVIGPVVKAAWGKIAAALAGGGGTALFAKIEAALAAIPVWGWIAAAVVALIAGAIALAVVDYDFTEAGETFGKYFGYAFKYLTPVGWAIMLYQWIADGVMWAVDYLEDHSWGELFSTIWDSVVKGAKSAWNSVATWWEEVGKDMFAGIWEGFLSGLDNLGENLAEFFTGFWRGICEVFGIHSPAETMKPVGRYIVEGIWAGITGAFYWIVTMVKIWATDLISKITESMKPSAISSRLSTMWTNAKNWWNNSKGVLSTYTPSIGDIKGKLSAAWTSAKSWWDKSKSNLATYTPSIGSIKDKLSSAWTTAKNWWSKSKGSLSYTPTIGSIKDKLMSAWNTAKNWWNKNVKLSIPSLSFKVSYTTKGLNTVQTAIVKALGLSGWPKLSFAANGGVFDAGSLIWAGEAGAEVVANAGGGKTGVMNIEQMQEAVYEGVYAAVMAAMRASGGNGGSRSVNVYLDGKQITNAVEQRQHERGASLMGSQVYAY